MPTDLPRRRRRQGIGSRGRITLVVLAVALFLLLTSLRGIAGFYTDLLWFDSLGFRRVFTGVLGAKITLAVIFSVSFFALLWINLLIADRLAPRFRPAGPEEEVIERYNQLIGHRTGVVRLAISILFGLIAGAGVSGKWQVWLLFRHAQTFGTKDPQFHKDVGFYVFKLPFLTFVVDWLFASIVIILIVTAVAHYVNGGIRLQGIAQRVTPQVKAHLSVLLGLLAVVKAGGYYLQRYQLNFSTRGAVDGATYTDVKAQLPAINLLIIISGVAVVLFIVNIWRRGWVLPVVAVGLWTFIALVVGGIYPAFVQRVQVQPSESSKERPYIARNIVATRAAMNLSTVGSTQFAADNNLTAADLKADADTVRNIRLWDPNVIRNAYERLQKVRDYYNISDVDVDRYTVDGQETQVLLSARDLQTSGVPQSSWEARHLTYTNGHGIVVAPANAKDANGRPVFLARDVPMHTTVPDLNLKQAAIYVGQGQSGYVIVNTKRSEIAYQDQNKTVFTKYSGKDGIGIGSLVRRAAFSLRFGDINPLISGNIGASSKILIVRDVRERVQHLAPFLKFDHDPYVVADNGKLEYIIDGYTTTDRYPYAQRADTTDLPGGSDLASSYNYVRNSVKAVVDAYDGTTTFYVADTKDPVLRAYREMFPKLFTDLSKASTSLRSHFRYPEDLFRVQTNMWGRYHITNADDFYNKNDAWNVAKDPGTAGTTSTATQTTDSAGNVISSKGARIEPYYLLMRLPGETDTSFLIFRPFVPTSTDDSLQNLTAFMIAKSDPANYGKLETFVMPRGDLPPGPVIAAAAIGANAEVSPLQTLLSGKGSTASFGNLVLVPIKQSLLYVRPFYVESDQSAIPELRKVIVYFNGRVVVADTLQEALTSLFGDAPPTLEQPSNGSPTPAPVQLTVNDLLTKAIQAFDDAQKALTAGDLGTYQKKINEARDDITEAQKASSGASSSSSSTSTSTTSTTTKPA
ncbi:MAG: uncharacterized protein QOI47_679 [Actinomycetota bacterium]|jgi:uncharacterized membrane protein (UPF0182 family)|nr:uncharacterized protein [Actinomycetota bacterium]